MPGMIYELSRALLYSAARGRHFDHYTTLLRQAGQQASSTQDLPTTRQKLERLGRGNLGLTRLVYGETAMLEKRVFNVAEYLVTSLLSKAGFSAHNARIYATGQRGPLFYIFQEFVPYPADDINPDEYAEMALGFSSQVTHALHDKAPSRANHYQPMKNPRFLDKISQITGEKNRAVAMGISEILNGCWKIHHNDLHLGNVRRRENGIPVMIDMGSVAWNVEGSDFAWLVPDGRGDPQARTRFDSTTSAASDRLGKPAVTLRKAALLCAASRHLRRARRHRNKERESHAARIVADALSLSG